MLVCAFFCAMAHETAGAARTRSSLRPLFSRRANYRQASGTSCREIGKSCSLFKEAGKDAFRGGVTQLVRRIRVTM